MIFVDKNVEFLGLCPTEEEAALKHIELCGRRCYKSEHKIDNESRSFEKFYRMLMNNGHVSAIEHSNIVIEFQCNEVENLETLFASFVQSALGQMAYFRVMPIESDCTLTVSGNIRAWVEFFQKKFWFALYNETADFLVETYPTIFFKLPEYVEAGLSERAKIPGIERDKEAVGDVFIRVIPTNEIEDNLSIYEVFDIPAYTFAVYTDRGISHEIVRHRVLSFSQESTRYVNYSKHGLQFVEWDVPTDLRDEYDTLFATVEDLYNKLIKAGVKPQFARNILPNSTKTEIAITGRLSGWDHFISLRMSPAAHPDIQFVAEQINAALYCGLDVEDGDDEN